MREMRKKSIGEDARLANSHLRLQRNDKKSYRDPNLDGDANFGDLSVANEI